MKKNIILITSYFPYYPGEQFLETEIKFWENNPDIKLTIMPQYKGHNERKISESISMDLYLINPKLYMNMVIYSLNSFFFPLFYKELWVSIKNHPLGFITCLKSFSKYLYYKKKFRAYLESTESKNIIFYTYWYCETTYALQSLRSHYDFKLITRTHRADLYQEQRKYNYLPLRTHFTSNIDKIFTITDSAIDYCCETYGFKKKLLETSHLGVNNNNIMSESSKDGIYHIVSCSFLTEVKKIDKIILALQKLTIMKPTDSIIWTHIGSGQLEEELKSKANYLLSKKSNISVNFLGELKNKQVYQFYKENNVDVFINVSESEGVPVSIMEAISCHIPIIAPSVGGIPDIVINNYNGILLNKTPSINEISNALSQISFFKLPQTRDNSFRLYTDKYDAKINYTNFIQKICLL